MVNHKLLLSVQMHMSSNMLQSVETSMFKEHSRKNYVRDVDICTQVYYSFIETIWNLKNKSSCPNYVGMSIVDFLEHTRC
jgi:hypothetical protein